MEYYNILGVKKDASPDEIKKAYKKLVITHHPDKGGDEKKMQEIQNAYNVLSDPEKRHNYDTSGNENNNGFGFRRGPNPEDIFAHFFGGGRMPPGFGGNPRNSPVRRNDIITSYEISLRDAFKGIKKTVKIKTKCYHFDKLISCNKCQGMGTIKNIVNKGGFKQIFESKCQHCKGSCYENLDKASYENEKQVQLVIPSGVTNDYNIVIDGCGEQPKTKHEKPGNLVFRIIIKPNDVFTRINNDLHATMSIDFISSIVGCNVTFNIMDEDKIEFNTKQFNIIHPNKKYKFENKGMPILNNSKRGDLYLEFNVDYPVLTNEQRNEIQRALFSICGVKN